MNRLFLIFLCCISLLISCSKPQTLEQLPSRYVACDDFKVHYKSYGSGDPTLVFVHGFGCDMESWREQFPFFAQKDFHMVFIDLPGFGMSDKPHVEYSFDFFAHAIKTVLDSLQIAEPILVGHSLGAPICRQVTRNYPELIATLCKVDEAVSRFPADSVGRQQYLEETNGVVEMFASDSIQETLQLFISSLFQENTPQAVKDYAFGVMSQTPQYIALSTMRNFVNEPYWDETSTQIPTLAVVSKNSVIWDDNEAYLRQMFPNLTYREMSDVSHFLMMERSDEFNQILFDFISDRMNK